jgi:mono/diheme cytochrome c family protein
MKIRIMVGLVLAIVIAVPVVVNAKGDATAGKAVYAKRCAACHGPNGEGKESIEKMFKVEMHALGSKTVQALSDADLRKVMLEGKGKMKPVKELGDADVANVIAFIRSLSKK